MNDKPNSCKLCAHSLDFDQPYVYVDVRPFVKHLEPQARISIALHARCYDNSLRPPWLPGSRLSLPQKKGHKDDQ